MPTIRLFMAIANPAALYLEAFSRLFFPAYCGVCHGFLALSRREICAPCSQALEKLCRAPHRTLVSTRLRGIHQAWALLPYQTPVRELLRGLKFGGRRGLLKPFEPVLKKAGVVLAAETSYDLLLPVPMDPARKLEREFNQAELIARRVSKAAGVPLLRGVLQKHAGPLPQSELSRAERRVNLQGTFWVRRAQKIRQKTVLLVDDIMTTGATAAEAARTLKKAGAKRVDFLALARTHLKS